jgi:hypothetical protein
MIVLPKMTYSIKMDDVGYYIRSDYPFCYVTGNLSLKEAKLVAQSLRQLGYTVSDES